VVLNIYIAIAIPINIFYLYYQTSNVLNHCSKLKLF